MTVSPESTWVLRRSAAGLEVPSVRVTVSAGQDAGLETVSAEGRMSIGTADTATLRLTDPTVSRFHLELETTPRGIVVRDLGSTNGTRLGKVQINEIVLSEQTELALGRTRVRIAVDALPASVAVHQDASFHGLVGASAAMRAVFAKLERAASTNATILVTGESGTGKELAARAVHDASPRRDGPFEVVDCGGLPPTLIESELFGHVRGSFTGATSDREGAFERADGGTLFLDELGELPLELQPKLLRVLGERQVRPIGARAARPVDARIVAATNRDLRKLVNSGQFRADLYYRLAVIEVHLPALRDRFDDLPVLVRSLLDTITRDRGLDAYVTPDDALLAALAKHAWPGNVRELRNYLDRMLILEETPALGGVDAIDGAPTTTFDGLEAVPLREAKALLLERFERHYVGRLLSDTGGNIAEAARRAGVDRGTLFRMLRRHGKG